MDNHPEQLYSASQMQSVIQSLAHNIFRGMSAMQGECALVGMHQQGVPLAQQLAEIIKKDFNYTPLFGTLDISMYRDDIGNRSRLPLIRETSIPFDVNNKNIILVDDVLSTGRTIRAALDALTDYGRPKLIRLAVLVDRGETEFPIRADFVGVNLSIPEDHKIRVSFSDEEYGEPGIYDIKWPK